MERIGKVARPRTTIPMLGEGLTFLSNYIISTNSPNVVRVYDHNAVEYVCPAAIFNVGTEACTPASTASSRRVWNHRGGEGGGWRERGEVAARYEGVVDLAVYAGYRCIEH